MDRRQEASAVAVPTVRWTTNPEGIRDMTALNSDPDEPEGTRLNTRDFNETRLLREVAVDALVIDAGYQRERNDPLVDEIVGDLSWALFGVITVSSRGTGQYAVIDGQNRAEGARRRGIEWVPALILVGLTREEEAATFADLQRKRRNNSALDGFKADVVAKRRRALEISQVFDSRGVTAGRGSGHGNDRLYKVGAISAVQDVWAWGGVELVAAVFDAIMIAWPDATGRFRGEIIRPLGRYIIDNEPEPWRLVLALEAIGGPDTLLERAAYLRKGRGMGKGTEKWPMEVVEGAYVTTRTTT
jgi:hypothetical protein